jgi:hypothetical protein
MKKPHKSTFDAHDWHDRRCADSVPGFFGASLRVFPCGKKRDAIGKAPIALPRYGFAVDGQLSFTPNATSSEARGGPATDETRGEGEGHQ